jgi:hypothetical protein
LQDAGLLGDHQIRIPEAGNEPDGTWRTSCASLRLVVLLLHRPQLLFQRGDLCVAIVQALRSGFLHPPPRPTLRTGSAEADR